MNHASNFVCRGGCLFPIRRNRLFRRRFRRFRARREARRFWKNDNPRGVVEELLHAEIIVLRAWRQDHSTLQKCAMT